MNIRVMRAADLDFCLKAVEAEGWLSETRYTFETFLLHDQSGCLIAEENGQPIGMCVATPYRTCGFLGELIVIPRHRGRGSPGADRLSVSSPTGSRPLSSRYRKVPRPLPGRRAAASRPD